MWTRWFPWRRLASWVARSLGFTDPVAVLERLERLSRPSEVLAPMELLRAGAAFHARGLVNARVLQYHLDWAWPWWVRRQYDPRTPSFVPRAFSLTHVNLTHRNWTAVGVPDVDHHPLVDPRGLTTPLHDGWSLDAWLVGEDGRILIPAEASDCAQTLALGPEDGGPDGMEVRTRTAGELGVIDERVSVGVEAGPRVRIRVRGEGHPPGWIALVLRPANPEGVTAIHRIERIGPAALRVDGSTEVRFDRPPERFLFSTHLRGDVLHHLPPGTSEEGPAGADVEHGRPPTAPAASVECPAGLATAAALFPLDRHGEAEVTAEVPLAGGSPTRADASVSVEGPPPSGEVDRAEGGARGAWRAALEGAAELRVPDARLRFLYDAAVRGLILHSPGDIYPGPFTYRRFWFRDAAFIVDALCSVGLGRRARRALARYPARQEDSGYFRSQQGEWDSNGAALWAVDRWLRLTGEAPFPGWREAARKGAEWIVRKRMDPALEAPHAGLLPAGFSAEHLGPNDHYYWDDFWSAAGLFAAARLAAEVDEDPEAAVRWSGEARDLLDSVDRSIVRSPGHRETGGVPASPYRRMDAGAVGSLAAGYPLRLWPADDPRLLATANHLLEHHTVDGGFFQDMIHSGINPYLTLHLAQVLLRAGDPRHEGLVRTVAELASPTGQWPEAVHPNTGGGCMGDGQHAWASAEWVLAIRNWFVREEGEGLVLASGIPPAWVRIGDAISFGPAPTPHGPVTVRVQGGDHDALVEWEADWRSSPPEVEVRLPGHAPAAPAATAGAVRVRRLDPLAGR